MSVITHRETWELDTQEKRMKKGPLVKVEIRPGQYVKMYESDAIAKGLIKARSQPQNKMRAPAANKASASPESVEEKTPEAPPADDFTAIDGVGPATARALVAHGITTFEQLKGAGELSYLAAKVNEAIAAWRARD